MDGSAPSYPGAALTLSTGGTLSTIDANGAAAAHAAVPGRVLKNARRLDLARLQTRPSTHGSAGKFVVTARGTCARVARAVFGERGRRAAVVMVNNGDALPAVRGQDHE